MLLSLPRLYNLASASYWSAYTHTWPQSIVAAFWPRHARIYPRKLTWWIVGEFLLFKHLSLLMLDRHCLCVHSFSVQPFPDIPTWYSCWGCSSWGKKNMCGCAYKSNPRKIYHTPGWTTQHFLSVYRNNSRILSNPSPGDLLGTLYAWYIFLHAFSLLCDLCLILL